VNDRLGSFGGDEGRRRCHRAQRAAALGIVLVLPVILSFAGAAITAPSDASYAGASATIQSLLMAASTEPGRAGVLANCSIGYGQFTYYDAYDPADGYLYVTSSNSSVEGAIFIVKPPCTLVSTITPGGYNSVPYGVVYDPLTKEMVVTDSEAGVAYVLRDTVLVRTVSLGGVYECPSLAAWDPAVDAVLIADSGGACEGGGYGPDGVSVLHLSIVDGVTRVSAMRSAFDRGDYPTDVLVADGYIFTVGADVKVFNDRSFAYLGEFPVGLGLGGASQLDIFGTLAWDPLNDTVVLGIGNYYPGYGMGHGGSVHFLNAHGINSGQFTSNEYPADGILHGGVGQVVYSPATEEVYLTSDDGPNVWELNESGVLTHVFLGRGSDGLGLTYDPLNHDMYVCGSTDGYGEVFVIH
jgi:hypothetical protein